MSAVMDASALLAFVRQEEGAEVVEAHLVEQASCSSANWSEVSQKVLASGRNWGLVSALLGNYPLQVEPVTREDAEWAASRWRPGDGLSLADRLCLALAARLDSQVLTADRSWGSADPVVQIR